MSVGTPWHRQISTSSRSNTGSLQMLQPILWRELGWSPFQRRRSRCKECHLQVNFPSISPRDVVDRYPIFTIQ